MERRFIVIKLRLTDKPEYFKCLVDLTTNIEGNIVELGVGAAKSAKLLCQATKETGRIRDYWGFDSFDGFPAPTIEDRRSSKHNLKKGYFVSHWCRTEEEAANRITVFCDYPKESLHFIKGFFSKALFRERYDDSPIAILHLDCDLYQSYWIGLNYFSSYVAKGGIIVFDEYRDPVNLKEWPGAVRAIDEWLRTMNYTRTNLSVAYLCGHRDREIQKFFLVTR